MVTETQSDADSPRARGERLKRLRLLGNVEREAICSETGININTYIGYEVGRHGGLTSAGAQKILKALAKLGGVYCTYDWLMFNIGVHPAINFNYNSENQNSALNHLSTVNQEHKNILEEILYFRNKYKNTCELMINDDGMLPFYNEGDYVAGIKRYKEQITSLIGCDCIIQTKAGDILLRRLKGKTDDNKYTLICLNLNSQVSDPMIKDVELVYAAPVIWHRKREPQ